MAQITIIGLGIVGTSLGMALGQALTGEKGRQLADMVVVGYDRERQAVEQALVKGGIDRIAAGLDEAVQQANIVIIAQSTPEVGETLRAIAPLLPSGCIVTDTAGSKVQVLKLAEQLVPEGIHFVGGHPIIHPEKEADWSKSVKEAARADLFRDGIYCLVPAPQASEQAVDTVKQLAQLVGADPFFLDSWEHDGLIAGLAQAPYLLTGAMLGTIAASSAWRDLKLLADPTFRYMIRVLNSQPEGLYQECLANRQPLLSWLDRAAAALQQLRRELAAEDSTGEYMQNVLGQALDARQDWSKRRDERRKELSVAGMDQVASVRKTFLSMFIPGALLRGPGKKEEKK